MRISPPLLFAFGLLTLLAFSGVNAWLGVLSLIVLAVGLLLLWRPNISPVFAFVFFYQWLQASTKIFQGNLLGSTVEELAQFGGDVSTAIVLSLVGLGVLAIGMRLGLGSDKRRLSRDPGQDANAKSVMFWFWCYAAAFVVALGAQAAASVFPGFSQPLLALAGLKWAFYWIFTQVAITKRGLGAWLLAAAFAVELGLGFGGYFSGFKTVLFFTMFGLLSSGVRLTVGRFIGLLFVGALTLTLAVGWTAIKTEQRRFLSQGQRSQIVLVSREESLANMIDLASKLDGDDLSKAANALARRLSYVDFFARVIETVPTDVPHENGALWLDAVARPFMPRILFPEKTAIDDSERTNYYTGLGISGAAEGTSISIGYVGESYIDFGPWLMMAPIFLLGWGLSRFYRWMVEYKYSRGVVGMGLATATVFPAAYFETSITKLIGGLVVSMLVSWLLARWVVPRFFSRTRRAGGNYSPVKN